MATQTQSRTSEQRDRGSQQTDTRNALQTGGQPGRGGAYQAVTLLPRDLFRSSSLAAMNPFSMLRRMMEAVDPAAADGGFTPAVEVYTRDNQMIVRVDLPGMRADEVTVEIADNALVIEGERRYERRHNEGGYFTTEVRYGRFLRTIPLPDGADIDQIQARFDNGVLEISVPMPPQQSRQIPVSAGSGETSQNKGSQQPGGTSASGQTDQTSPGQTGQTPGTTPGTK